MPMRALFLTFAFALAACAPPASQPSDGVRIDAAWASPTPGGADVSAGYLSIVNGGDAADQLIGAQSPRAASVELHTMEMDGGVMRMRHIDSLDIPAGETVALAPGGRHLMFMGLTAPFAEGEDIPVQLTFAHAGVVEVTLPVRRRGEHTGH